MDHIEIEVKYPIEEWLHTVMISHIYMISCRQHVSLLSSRPDWVGDSYKGIIIIYNHHIHSGILVLGGRQLQGDHHYNHHVHSVLVGWETVTRESLLQPCI